MEDTCTYPKCPHAKLTEELCSVAGVKSEFPRECGNFIEAWWTDEKKNQKVIKDCAPRRTLLMVQDLFNRQIGLQKAQEEQRNASTELVGAMAHINNALLRRLDENEGIPGNGRILIETTPS